jgi:hypothetical protein
MTGGLAGIGRGAYESGRMTESLTKTKQWVLGEAKEIA